MRFTTAYTRLREHALTNAKRLYAARGCAVVRCTQCFLAEHTCICAWRRSVVSALDVVLIYHHDEIFKPTNTGRLVADVLPDNTMAFEWSRTQPPADLLAVLQDPSRYCVLLFPTETEQQIAPRELPERLNDRRLTLILLDGTWKQAKKMSRASEWLNVAGNLTLTQQFKGGYSVRQAITEGQLSTAEAAACALMECGEVTAGQVLHDYFTVFNVHYVATRRSTMAEESEAHQRLMNMPKSV